MTAVLEARGLCAGYGSLEVVRDIDITVNAGEVAFLLGPNGAGKTTTLLALAGEVQVMAGETWLADRRERSPLHQRARRGLSLVTDDRAVFMRLTTMENLRVGRVDPERALTLFPELRTRLRVKAGNLSGGEQQMLTLARALARRPTVLLADEISLGLAPLIAQRLFAAVREAALRDNVGVLLVAQSVREAMDFGDRIHLMGKGRIEMSGTTAEMSERVRELESSYLGGDVAPEV